MNRTLTILAATGALALVAGRSASAQAPKPGDFYEDAVDLGFKVKMPKDWDFSPPQPGEQNLIGKYTPAYTKYVNLGPDEVLWLEGYLLKFDRRAKEEGEAITQDEEGDVEIDVRKLQSGAEDIGAWLERNMGYGTGYRQEEEDETKVGKVPATRYLFKGSAQKGTEFNVYAMVFHLQPEVDVAVVFDGPADPKKWRKYESAFKQMASSFRTLEVEAMKHAGVVEGDSAYRAQKRALLEKEVALSASGGWKLYETPNYFFVSNVQDVAFMDELMARLEAIRVVYEELYPWEQAERIRLAAEKQKKGKEGPAGEGHEGGDDEGDEGDETGDDGLRTSATKATSREKSRCSVVRVCAKQGEYHEYGGPGGSAGYWAAMHEELVLFDDKEGGGRRDTWAVLNHEAFHQYIFYLYGSISPHSWYNEGHGDFFSGYQYKHKKFTLKPFDWRQRTIQQAVREKPPKHVPLKDLVRFTQAEYYGSNKYGVDPGQNYAQGWSFVYFLRTGKGKSSLWNKAWDNVLDVYFETLAATGDLDAAIDKAFAGVDWDELEEAWKQYTL